MTWIQAIKETFLHGVGRYTLYPVGSFAAK